MSIRNLTAKQQIQINTSKTKVWEGLTGPKRIKQYLFGSETLCDWEEGGRIIYPYEWEGKRFEDRD
ncbi:MAG: hypothetical protein EPN39_06025 [Chitinophagaceae bacterium]|nr:MAG: hypothetical protein EPN39_06025 [Chitinophagaceae bacterium]